MGEVTAAKYAASSLSSSPRAWKWRMTGCQPVGKRVSTALPSRCRATVAPPCLELPPEAPLPLSQDFYRHTGCPAGYLGHTPRHQLARLCARMANNTRVPHARPGG